MLTASTTAIDRACASVCATLVTCTVNPAVPGAVGVPVIAPMLACSASPAGSEPATTAQLYVPLPPVATSVWLYARPTVPPGSDVVSMLGRTSAVVTAPPEQDTGTKSSTRPIRRITC